MSTWERKAKSYVCGRSLENLEWMDMQGTAYAAALMRTRRLTKAGDIFNVRLSSPTGLRGRGAVDEHFDVQVRVKAVFEHHVLCEDATGIRRSFIWDDVYRILSGERFAARA